MRLSQSNLDIIHLPNVGCGHVHMWDAPRYEWWVPLSGREDWYFWTPRKGPHPGSIELDYTTADDHMRELLKNLHSIGVATMPSCTGHRPEPENLLPRLDAIDRCSQLIRGNGLLFENVENGRLGFYLDHNWLPPDKSELAQMAIRDSMVGYLGMVDPLASGKLRAINRHISKNIHCGPSLVRDPRGEVLDFTVVCPTWDEQVEFWDDLTRFCSEHL